MCCKDNTQRILKPHLLRDQISTHPSFFIVDPEGAPTTYSISGVQQNSVNTLVPSLDSSGSGIESEAEVMAAALSNGETDKTLLDLSNSPLLADIDPSLVTSDKPFNKKEVIIKDIPTSKGDLIIKEEVILKEKDTSSSSSGSSGSSGSKGLLGGILGKIDDDSPKNTPVKNIPKASDSGDLSRSKVTIKPGQVDRQERVASQPKPQADIPRINKANIDKKDK
jgi:hypothetical protein